MAGLTAASGGTAGAFSYDDSGNLVAKDGTEFSYGAHRLRTGTADGEQVYSADYDACGRVIRRIANGATTTFGYDGYGALSVARDQAGRVILQVVSSHLDRPLKQTGPDGAATVYVHAGYQHRREADGATSSLKFLSDDRGVLTAITRTGGTRKVQYFRHDRKGSTTHVFDASGRLMAQISYTPYGTPLLERPLPAGTPTYERREWESDLGLLCFGSRFYDPGVGRFLTPDTQIGGSSSLQQDSLNPFSFELNNPVNYIDPTGHDASWVGGLVIGLALVAGAVAVAASGGSAAVALGLLGAGISGISFSATHTDSSTGHFWEGFVASAGVGFVVGWAGGALGAWATESLPAWWAVSATFTERILVYAPMGAAIGAASDTASQFASNVIDADLMDEGTDLDASLGRTAWIGAVFGAVGGGLQAGVERMSLRLGNQVAPDIPPDMVDLRRPEPLEMHPVVLGEPQAAPRQQILMATTKAKALVFVAEQLGAAGDTIMQSLGGA